MPHIAPYVVNAGGQGLLGVSLGFHAYSLRIDNLSNQWLQEESSLAWIPPYSLGVVLKLYGTSVALLLFRAPTGQPQLQPVPGEYAVAMYSDETRNEVAGVPVREFSIVQAVTDLTWGSQPALPPPGVTRMYADASGTLHYILPSGTDRTLIDTGNLAANVNTLPLGGDARGTINLLIHSLRNASWFYGHDSSGNEVPILTNWTDNRLLIQSTTQTSNISFRRGGDTTELVVFGASGGAPGWIGIGSGQHSSNPLISLQTRVGSQISLYDSGSGNGFGFGVTSGELVIYATTGNVVGFRSGSISAARNIYFNLDSGGMFATSLQFINSNNYVYISFPQAYYMRLATPSSAGSGFWQFFDSYGNYYQNWQLGGDNGGVMHITGYNKLSAAQWLIEGSAYSYIAAGRSSNELSAQVHLYVPGNIVYGGSISPSSRALKRDIATLSDVDCLARVAAPEANPITYAMREPVEPGPETLPETQIGFIAEDMVNVVPEAVPHNTETGEPAGILYNNLIPLMWGAIRALDGRLNAAGL